MQTLDGRFARFSTRHRGATRLERVLERVLSAWYSREPVVRLCPRLTMSGMLRDDSVRASTYTQDLHVFDRTALMTSVRMQENTVQPADLFSFFWFRIRNSIVQILHFSFGTFIECSSFVPLNLILKINNLVSSLRSKLGNNIKQDKSVVIVIINTSPVGNRASIM